MHYHYTARYMVFPWGLNVTDCYESEAHTWSNKAMVDAFPTNICTLMLFPGLSRILSLVTINRMIAHQRQGISL